LEFFMAVHTNIPQTGKANWTQPDVPGPGSNSGGANHGKQPPTGKPRDVPAPGIWNSANGSRYPGANESAVATMVEQQRQNKRLAQQRQAEVFETHARSKATATADRRPDISDAGVARAITVAVNKAQKIMSKLPRKGREGKLTLAIMNSLADEGYPFYNAEHNPNGVKVMIHVTPRPGSSNTKMYAAHFLRGNERRVVFLGRD
jgi:hypothetical protein